MAPPVPTRPAPLPPQPDRLALPLHRTRTSSPHAPQRRDRALSRYDGFQVLDNSQIHVDSSSSDDDFRPKRPQRPQHGRSVSNPFPLFFSTKKKNRSAAEGSSESDSGREDRHMPKHKERAQAGAQPQTSLQVPGQSQHRTHKRGGNVSGSKDFATGNCMTCGSLVRWPRELKVFKCTICLTINDVQPHVPEPRHDASTRRGRGNDRSADAADMPPPSFNPISLDLTKALIRQCLQSFLNKAVASQPNHVVDHPDGTTNARKLSPGFSSETIVDVEPPGIPSIAKSQTDVSGTPPGQSSSILVDGPREVTLLPRPSYRDQAAARSYSTSYPDRRPSFSGLVATNRSKSVESDSKRIFKPLEDYLVASFSSLQCINSSFVDRRCSVSTQTGQHQIPRKPIPEHRKERGLSEPLIPEFDAKMLLLGDVAENGTLWTGGQQEALPTRSPSHKSGDSSAVAPSRSARMDWTSLDDWYASIINCGETWTSIYEQLAKSSASPALSDDELRRAEAQILQAQGHAQRLLLKATEMILKRPGCLMGGPRELRFLLIILANPLIHASCKTYEGIYDHDRDDHGKGSHEASGASGPAAGKHSGIIKRVLGLISHSSPEYQNHMVAWMARFSETRFIRVKDLVSGFLAYRLIRQNDKKQEVNVDVTNGLIPNMSAGRTPASLHAALGQAPGSSKKPKEPPKKMLYHDDWQIKAASHVMGLLFAANNSGLCRRQVSGLAVLQNDTVGYASSDRVHARGQILPTSDFYTALLDESDLVADFETWEHKRGKFSFCQYPFLLSIWAKIQILEHDAKRQMHNKARDAFFASILSRRTINQYLVLNIRRDCLVEDSLKAVSEVIGSGGEDIKKGLRIVFQGEEGIDAGGLRKEWFLMLVREVFNPEHGMFIYDEDSHFCYFNPHSFETSDQFFLVGVVMGLAIYNSTILDVALPPFAFRKLLLAAPPPHGVATHPKQAMNYTLDDLAEYRPWLARGLRQLLEYDGDVQSTFCLDFAVDVPKYGSVDHVPLCPGGEKKPVTNTNRREYVDLYVRYLLDTAVTRQFEPFKRGFFTVCGGNALSLFRPEEIELLVRGSDDALDIASIRAVASYDGWSSRDPDGAEPTVGWFWESFEQASPKDQRKLLLFITGSDRIPAMGAASLSIRIVCLGDDDGRYPTARTCFNTLALWRYRSQERLESMLWGAVHESEGFGLK